MSVWAETKDDLRIFYHNNKIVLVLKQQYIKRNKIGKLASEMVNRDLLPRDMWIKRPFSNTTRSININGKGDIWQKWIIYTKHYVKMVE